MIVQLLTRTVSGLYSKPHRPVLCTAALVRRLSKLATGNSTKSKMLVAVGQMRATNDKKENLQKVTHLIEKAKEQNVKFLFLPECCDFVGENRQETLALAEPLSGPTVAAYADLAKKNDMWMSLGGIHETILDSAGEKTDKIYNAHVIIDNKGDIVQVYHKLHLFDVTTPEFRFRESDVVSGGDRIVPPVKTPFGNLGMLICYDVRFPEVAIQLRKLGAEILTYPAAFAFSTGKAHWEVLLRARAIENQCYVIAAAQIGFHNVKRQSYGHAMIVDPWGKILATTGEAELDISIAELDLPKMSAVRANVPCYSHRRNDVYNLTAVDGIDLEGADRRFGSQTIRNETIFFESPHCYAFTNLRCVVKGHVLISTKRWAARLCDLQGDEITDLFRTVCKIERMLEDIYKTASSTVTVQDGVDAGQTVEHVHFHVMPRRPGDFNHNDQIYVQLEKFSKAIRDRTLEERIEEAEIYRRYLDKKLPTLS